MEIGAGIAASVASKKGFLETGRPFIEELGSAGLGSAGLGGLFRFLKGLLERRCERRSGGVKQGCQSVSSNHFRPRSGSRENWVPADSETQIGQCCSCHDDPRIIESRDTDLSETVSQEKPCFSNGGYGFFLSSKSQASSWYFCSGGTLCFSERRTQQAIIFAGILGASDRCAGQK